ncbi:hypothetical protein, conserved in T. vivax [Trypanosoma vivax Y486]|uniref:Uncharacterized protein n=1 Tax=Trypanosoma vivax (strain Y486) TaxID=1055687 RepID=F9WQI1_TRYVY|nr:hypothetical protein, conserved in T. vivax [Trypanosoma vivax Y486]|eukprot:CCD19809.1 hypothetical protein, conserved in T. vivax [Trypanosoma vivax Y486]
MLQAIRVARYLALSAAIAAIACAHAAAQRGTEHTMPKTNAGKICDTSSKMKQLAERLAREAHTKVAAATTLRARAGALQGDDETGGRGAAQGDAARSAVEAADAAVRETTAMFRKALAAHGRLTHLAGQIDGWMLQLATYNGGQSGQYNVQCISTGDGQSSTAEGADKYRGPNAQAKVNAQLENISDCLALPAHAPEASEALTQVTVKDLEDALKVDAFVVPFDGATTTGAALELQATGLAADTGCNLLSGNTRDSKAALFDTRNGANPFGVFGGLWIASATKDNKGIKLTITKAAPSKSSYSGGTAVIGAHESNAEQVTKIDNAKDSETLKAALTLAEEVEAFLNGSSEHDGTAAALLGRANKALQLATKEAAERNTQTPRTSDLAKKGTVRPQATAQPDSQGGTKSHGEEGASEEAATVQEERSGNERSQSTRPDTAHWAGAVRAATLALALALALNR